MGIRVSPDPLPDEVFCRHQLQNQESEPEQQADSQTQPISADRRPSKRVFCGLEHTAAEGQQRGTQPEDTWEVELRRNRIGLDPEGEGENQSDKKCRKRDDSDTDANLEDVR